MIEDCILVNGKKENLSIDTKEPIILNWRKLQLQQKSARITVTHSRSIVFETNYRETTHPFLEITLPYSESRKKYRIQLEIITEDDEVHSFQKNVYSKNDRLKEADWITRLDNPIEKEHEYYRHKPNMIIEKNFEYEAEEKEVFLDISGLGYYTVWINGHEIDNVYLNGDITSYSRTVYFDTYRIEQLLQKGENTITVELANGWYHPAPVKLLGKYNVRNRLAIGKPCMIGQISYTNAENELIAINSNDTWTSKEGKYAFNNLFIGEKIDYSQNNENNSEAVRTKTVKIIGPNGDLVPSRIDKIKRTKKISPDSISMLENVILIDFGRVMSGHFSSVFSGNINGNVRIKYSEALDSQGRPDYVSSISGVYGYGSEEFGVHENDPVIQMDEINLVGESIHFENQYVYHSFRYVVVEYQNANVNDLTEVCAYSVHTDLTEASSFESSDERLNLLWTAARDTKLNNIHSYFEDCPRERLGYGGDIVALIDSQIYSFDVEQLLLKVFQDFANDQSNDGGITQTAPYIGIQTHGPSDRAGSLGWQFVFPILAKKINQFYYQPNYFEDNQDKLIKHLHYLLSFDYEYIKYCCLGDWGSMDSIRKDRKTFTPDQEFCTAVMYYLNLTAYRDLLLNKNHEELFKQLESRIEEVKENIMDEFYQEEGFFQTGTQSSFAFALHSKIVEGDTEKLVYENFIKKIKEDGGILRSGIFGMSWTYKILSEHGDNQLIFDWLLRKDAPGFLDMLSNGNQILREFFDAELGSYNHAMFSSYPAWMMEKLAGIEINSDSTAAGSVTISPYFPDGLDQIKGTVDTIRGEIMNSWKRERNRIIMSLQIPKSIDYKLKLDSKYNIVNQTEESRRGAALIELEIELNE